ncbi:hypothetical protein G9A89_004190 [Geosiphon pyriformis]|nr:hypothetical protein G9A89_004190 [Geosiphon pyriformis]
MSSISDQSSVAAENTSTITNNKSLAAIFPFELEKPLSTSLFSRAILEEKPITTMYTNAKVDGHLIKLILDSGSTGSIIIRQLMNQLDYQVDYTASAKIIMADKATKTPISKIDNFLFKVNSIITPIKILVIEAIQYQALVGNDWLIKTNAVLNWNMQELQFRTDNDQEELITWEWKENTKKKEKGKEEKPAPTTTATHIPYIYTIPLPSNYC